MTIAIQKSETIFRFEPECKAISFDSFQEILLALPYGHVCRVAIQLLAATGCRISELDKMLNENLLGNELYWSPGKNQRGLRKEQIPTNIIDELVYYRRHNRTKDSLLGVCHKTMKRYFNRDCRPIIKGGWISKHREFIKVRGWTEAYDNQLKGFRKTFQTVLFAYFYKKYNDAGVSLEKVSKRMKHSSKHITAYAYIEAYEQIDVNRWLEWLQTGRAPIQSRLFDYQNVQSVREKRRINKIKKLKR